MPSASTLCRNRSTRASVVSTPTSPWISKDSIVFHVESSISPAPNRFTIWPKTLLRVLRRLSKMLFIQAGFLSRLRCEDGVARCTMLRGL